MSSREWERQAVARDTQWNWKHQLETVCELAA
jgi:hypothetical protein